MVDAAFQIWPGLLLPSVPAMAPDAVLGISGQENQTIQEASQAMSTNRKPLAAIGKKLPTCQECRQQYVRERTGQRVCSIACGLLLVRRQQIKRAVEPYRTKPGKPNNSLSHQLELTQRVFNQWIRWRDHDRPCISSGRATAPQWDAGHFRPVGGMGGSILRFDPANCHKQCSEQNQHQSGNLQRYRVNLVTRIGIEEVERLESTNGTRKWDVDEVKEIRRHYRKLLRDEQAFAR